MGWSKFNRIREGTKLTIFGLALLCLVLLSCRQVWADETKKIEGTTNVEDAPIVSGDNADKNYGGRVTLYTGDPATYGSLIRVKNVTSELGAGATITACVCSAFCKGQALGSDVSAYRVFKPWVEGDEDGVDDDDGDVTWNDWASDTYEWTTAGCGSADDEGEDNSGNGTGADRKATAEDTETNVGSPNWYGWDISTELAQGWYDGTIIENGIILLGTTSSQHLSSTEDASNQPFFVFTYTTGSADTLQPVADQTINWSHTGCDADSYYQCVDDPPGSPDSTVTYAYTMTAINPEFYRVDSTFVSDIDSVVVKVNARKDGYADSTVYLYMGLGYKDAEQIWQWYKTDSITLTTGWADYSENLDYDPSWTYQEVNARRFGATSAYAKIEMVDTLQPTANSECVDWTISGCANAYECVDDPPGSPDGDATKVYTASNYKHETFNLEDASMSGDIDSLVIRINAKGAGSAVLQIGYTYDEWCGFKWVTHPNMTTDYTDYSAVSTFDENIATWTNAKINERAFGVYAGNIGGNQIDMTQVFVMVYYSTQVPSQMTQVFVIVYYTPSFSLAPDSIKIENEMSPGFINDLTPEFKCFYRDAIAQCDSLWWQVGTSVNDSDMWNSDWQNIANIDSGNFTDTIGYGGSALSRTTWYYLRAKTRNASGGISSWSNADSFRIVADDTVWVVLNVDTESGNDNIVEDFLHPIIYFDTWHQTGSDTGEAWRVFQTNWQNTVLDIGDNPPVFTWCIMAAEPYCSAASFNTVKEACNCIWDTLMGVWTDSISSQGHQVNAFHFHNYYWNGSKWVSQTTTFYDEICEQYLAMRLFDKKTFPSVIRWGWNWEDNTNQMNPWLDDRVFLDYTNVSVGGFWSGSPEGWRFYHPDTSNKNTEGNNGSSLDRYIGRITTTQGFSQTDVDAIYDSASAYGKAVGSFYVHPYDTMAGFVGGAYNKLETKSNSTGIPFLWVTASEAIAAYYGWTDTTKPTMNFVDTEDDSIRIRTSEVIFQSVPYGVSIDTSADPDTFVKIAMNAIDDTTWKWEYDAITKKVICAVTDTCGNVGIDSTELEPQKGIVRIYKNGEVMRIYENGKIVRIYEP